ncbi:MAG: winged helix-turn-helix domain-containing protein [Vampirovibrionia bacterium]
MLNQIGESAGKIYDYLKSNGEVTLATLKKNLELKGDLLTLSLGWLAREGKLEMLKKGNSTRIVLLDN